MSIRAALTRITAIQAGLSITDPLTLAVKRAYRFGPAPYAALPDLPCWTNSFAHDRTEVGVGMRVLHYVVRMQFAAAQATVEDDRASDIAAAFYQAALDAFCQDVDLADNVTMSTPRGGEGGVPAIIDRGGQKYVGFEMLLDVQITESFAWS